MNEFLQQLLYGMASDIGAWQWGAIGIAAVVVVVCLLAINSVWRSNVSTLPEWTAKRTWINSLCPSSLRCHQCPPQHLKDDRS